MKFIQLILLGGIFMFGVSCTKKTESNITYPKAEKQHKIMIIKPIFIVYTSYM